MKTAPKQKLDLIRDAWTAGDYKSVLRVASRFWDRSPETQVFKRGWDALRNPDFFRQIGKDPDKLVKAALSALDEKFELSAHSTGASPMETKLSITALADLISMLTQKTVVRPASKEAAIAEFLAALTAAIGEEAAAHSLPHILAAKGGPEASTRMEDAVQSALADSNAPKPEEAPAETSVALAPGEVLFNGHPVRLPEGAEVVTDGEFEQISYKDKTIFEFENGGFDIDEVGNSGPFASIEAAIAFIDAASGEGGESGEQPAPQADDAASGEGGDIPAFLLKDASANAPPPEMAPEAPPQAPPPPAEDEKATNVVGINDGPKGKGKGKAAKAAAEKAAAKAAEASLAAKAAKGGGKASKGAAAPQAPAAGGVRATAKAAAEAAAARGELPAPPNFEAATHKPYRKKLETVVELAKAGDIKGLKEVHINPISTSPKAIAKYRDLAVAALEARAKKAG